MKHPQMPDRKVTTSNRTEYLFSILVHYMFVTREEKMSPVSLKYSMCRVKKSNRFESLDII